MSDFKFACPICKQHITADASASGSQIDCPTCFQKIIVPQAPASPDTKLILSAVQPSKPKPLPHDDTSLRKRSRGSLADRIVRAMLLTALVIVAGLALYTYHEPLLKLVLPKPEPPPATNAEPAGAWTLDLAKAAFPDHVAIGKIKTYQFESEVMVLRGGDLSLRQGKFWPPDLGVSVQLFAQRAEDLKNKTIEISPDRTPPLPRVVVRWIDDHQEPVAETYTNGYLLRLTFGQPFDNKMPGRIYLCLPDTNQSFVSGDFEAEILKQSPAEIEPVPK